MSAAALNHFGGPEELTLQRVSVPDLDDDELLDLREAGVLGIDGVTALRGLRDTRGATCRTRSRASLRTASTRR